MAPMLGVFLAAGVAWSQVPFPVLDVTAVAGHWKGPGGSGRFGDAASFLVEQVKRNGRVVKTIRHPGSVVAKSPKTVATPWIAPAKPKGRYQHCVVAIDASSNKSPESCAKIVLK